MDYIFLFLCLFISLFILHSLSKDDFVLIRKNISAFQMFDLALLALVVSFIFGRVFYVLDTHNVAFVHLLRFFYIMKFPGFSFVGASIGFIIGVFLLFRGKSAFMRMFDMYSISFLPLFLFHLFSIQNIPHKTVILILGIPIISVVFLAFLKIHKDYLLKDGSISSIALLLIGAFSFYVGFVAPYPKIILGMSLSGIISIFVCILSFVLFGINERHLLKIRHAK
ncbi:MAG: prolipoprotein diacylglyceryl transferase [Candidatus Levybacteria bacterium]|nr:prolipoprotein diacylglyceryl transferase [Candidatus Levybacteria bacterium]